MTHVMVSTIKEVALTCMKFNKIIVGVNTANVALIILTIFLTIKYEIK